MKRIYVPSSGPENWKQFLAQPDLQWAKGYSARTLAHSWEAASGLPIEIQNLLEPLVGPSKLLIALPEHKVALPGGRRESQCDVFALIRGADQVIACAIEGKVEEPFGPTVGEWLTDPSKGKLDRLAFIRQTLGTRYQLLHRTAAAVIEADRFMAAAAAMIVHSFSPTLRWLEDFRSFARLFGLELDAGLAGRAILPSGKPLYLGWASGDRRFREL
jgi:hypothetical protein